jgi:hypothetical protein
MSEDIEKRLRINVYYEGTWRGMVHPDPARHRYIAWLNLRDGGRFDGAGDAILGYGMSHIDAVADALSNFQRWYKRPETSVRDETQESTKTNEPKDPSTPNT